MSTAPCENHDAIRTLDILINNVGTHLRAPLERCTAENGDITLNTNLKGPYLVAQALIQKMMTHGGGRIITICSMRGEAGRQTIARYAASKGGLKMLIKGMAVEWARHNIQISSLGPGCFTTELTQPLYEGPEFDAGLLLPDPCAALGRSRGTSGNPCLPVFQRQPLHQRPDSCVDGGLLVVLQKRQKKKPHQARA